MFGFQSSMMPWVSRIVTVFLVLPWARAFPRQMAVSLSEPTYNIQSDNIDYPEQIEYDEKLEYLGRILANILDKPWPKGVTPLVYIENERDTNYNQLPEEDEEKIEEDFNDIPSKRARYYRRYPWKRQNSRYDPDNRYLCQPSKDDVFRLLVALHEARRGNKGKTIHFCNRKRPATAIFTNIRFLGKRK